MKRLWLLTVFAFSLGALAQSSPSIQLIQSAPSGSCSQDLPDQQVIAAGDLYACKNGTWTEISGGGGSPGGATTNVQFNGSGSFGGDSSFTFNSTTKNVGVKAINGTSHSEMYAGSTLDVRVNACLSDAINHANGNVSGVCDTSGEPRIVQTIAAEIDVGDSNGDPVSLLMPCVGFWQSTISDGVHDVIKQWGGTTVKSTCPSSGTGGQMNIFLTSSAYPLYMYHIESNDRPYVYAQGFNITNISGGHATASGVGLFWQGTADASTLDSVNVYDSLDTDAAQVQAVCCQSTWIHSSINGGNGSTPLAVTAGVGNYTTGFTFAHGTIVHPCAGCNVIALFDAANSGISTADFNDIYTETGTNSNPTPLYSMEGWGTASFDHIRVQQFGSAVNPTFQVYGASYNTDLSVHDVFLSYGDGPWTYPVPVIENGYTGQTLYSDNYGNFDHYSIPSAPTNLGDATQIGDLPYAGASGVASHVPGNSGATDQVLVSHGTGLIATPTTKTCYVAEGTTVTTGTCTWSSSPVAGEFVAVQIYNYSGTTTSVTDSHGDTYTAVAGAHSATQIPGQVQLFYFGPLTSTITTLTVNSTSTAGLTIVADTATNIATTSPVDGAPCYADTFASTSSACSTALTTTSANDFIFCGAQNETGGDIFTAGSGFTAGANAGSANALSQYKVQSAVGSLTPAVTSSSASPMTMGCAAFKSVLATNAPTLTNAPALSAANMTSIPAPSAPLVIAGIVDGTAPMAITTGTSATLGGTYSSGYTVNEEGTAATAVTYTLPTAAAGKQYCVGNGYNGSAANTGALELLTSASGQFIVFTDGTLSATGGYVISGGAARDGACVVGVDSTHWMLYVNSGAWTKH